MPIILYCTGDIMLTSISNVRIVSLLRSARKRKLSSAAESKLVSRSRVNQKPIKSKSAIRSCWNTGDSVHSQAWFASTWSWGCDARKKHLLQMWHTDLNWSLLLITWTKQKTLGGNLCGYKKQKCSCLAAVSSNMFGGEKVGPLTPRTPDLLSNMVVVVLCCGAVSLPVDLLLYKK